jgi:hypothetical protein
MRRILWFTDLKGGNLRGISLQRSLNSSIHCSRSYGMFSTISFQLTVAIRLSWLACADLAACAVPIFGELIIPLTGLSLPGGQSGNSLGLGLPSPCYCEEACSAQVLIAFRISACSIGLPWGINHPTIFILPWLLKSRLIPHFIRNGVPSITS